MAAHQVINQFVFNGIAESKYMNGKQHFSEEDAADLAADMRQSLKSPATSSSSSSGFDSSSAAVMVPAGVAGTQPIAIAGSTKKEIEQRLKKRARRTSKLANIGDAAYLSASLPDNWEFAANDLEKKWVKRLSKNSRRSRSRYGRGLPKKGGAGGKGTWGKPGIDDLLGDDSLEDNYDSDDQENCEYIIITPPLNDEEIEKHVTGLVNEYFEHGDTDEVIMSLDEYNFDSKEHQIVVIAATLALEKKSASREMCSVLISDLYGRVLQSVDYETAFKLLIKNLPELILDTPDAPMALGNFVARAVADDCLPPKFIQSLREMPNDCPYVKTCIDHANALLNMKHGLVRLDTVWGVCGGMRPVKSLIRRIQMLLQEYISSGDVDEATRCLKELEVPHFHHELVYEAVILAIEDMKGSTLDLICKLLQFFAASTVVTLNQLINGFYRVYDEMHEICIDVPLAYQLLEKFVNKCATQGFIPKELMTNIPSRGRKRFVSEGDGGQIKD